MADKVLPSSLELCWGCSTPFYIPKKWLFINILLSRHQPSSPKALDMANALLSNFVSVFQFLLEISNQGL